MVTCEGRVSGAGDQALRKRMESARKRSSAGVATPAYP